MAARGENDGVLFFEENGDPAATARRALRCEFTEREIRDFKPEESWKLVAYFLGDAGRVNTLRPEWRGFVTAGERTQKDVQAWLGPDALPAVEAEVHQRDQEGEHAGRSPEKDISEIGEGVRCTHVEIAKASRLVSSLTGVLVAITTSCALTT